MAPENVDRDDVVADVLARGVPRRAVMQGLGGLGLMAALGALFERGGARAAAQDATAEAATDGDRSLDEILELPGVVLVIEWTPAGELAGYRAKIDIPEPEIERAARFGSIVAAALPTFSETYTELSGVKWDPANWVAFSGGLWSVIVGPSRAVMLGTASANLPEVFEAVGASATASAAPDATAAPDDAEATTEATAEPVETAAPEETVDAEETEEATAEAAVQIVDFAFEPAELEVTVGTTVTWTNAGERNHTATSDDDVFGSDRLGSGATFSFTFEEAGTFPYRCELHESMRATIVVAEE